MQTAEKEESSRKVKDSKEVVKMDYTEEEKARIDKYIERTKRESIKVFKKRDSSGNPILEIRETKPLGPVKMMESFGTPDTYLQKHFLDQIVLTFDGCMSSKGINYEKMTECANNAMSLLNGIQPRDEIEGMLAVQMIGVHNLAMKTLKQAMISDQTFEGKQANVNEATKMLRTFTAQMEALKKYRTGGQQNVTVKHVHVNQGGQAIVGAVHQGGGGGSEKKGG